jgi:phage/plasmid-associated DNA primase
MGKPSNLPKEPDNIEEKEEKVLKKKDESELVELSVSFSEKISENYNSHSYGGTWTVKIGKDDLEERTEEELTTFYLKRLRKIIKRNAGTEKFNISPEEINKKVERASRQVQKEKKPEKEVMDTIYKVLIERETDKAYQLRNQADLLCWIPKSTVSEVIDRKDGAVNIRLTDRAKNWLPEKMEWEAPSS